MVYVITIKHIPTGPNPTHGDLLGHVCGIYDTLEMLLSDDKLFLLIRDNLSFDFRANYVQIDEEMIDEHNLLRPGPWFNTVFIYSNWNGLININTMNDSTLILEEPIINFYNENFKNLKKRQVSSMFDNKLIRQGTRKITMPKNIRDTVMTYLYSSRRNRKSRK